MMLIKPRYLGPLVREEPLHDFIMEKANESINKFENYMDSGNMKDAVRELGRQEAFLDVLRFLQNAEWY